MFWCKNNLFCAMAKNCFQNVKIEKKSSKNIFSICFAPFGSIY